MKKIFVVTLIIALLMCLLIGLPACEEADFADENSAEELNVESETVDEEKSEVVTEEKELQDSNTSEEEVPDDKESEEDVGEQEQEIQEPDTPETDGEEEEEDEEENPITPQKDYARYWRDIMSEAPALGDVPINKLYMLGSHDTYTDKINIYSEPDTVYGNEFIDNENILKYFKGIVVNLSKAQADDIYEQLRHGVRSIDMRISEIDGELYNCHGLISDTLTNNLILTMKFLYDNPGEFIIINIHKYYSDDESYERLENYMRSVTYMGKNIFDYIHYDRDVHKFSSLSYNQVTNGGAEAGVIMFSTASHGTHPLFTQFNGYVYNPYQGDISSVRLLEKIVENLPNAKNYAEDCLMVCQSQTSPQEDNILATVKGFSLLKKAKTHNLYMLNCDELDDILDVFPIMQFDNATYNENGFLDGILAVMTNRNLALAED